MHKFFDHDHACTLHNLDRRIHFVISTLLWRRTKPGLHLGANGYAALEDEWLGLAATQPATPAGRFDKEHA